MSRSCDVQRRLTTVKSYLRRKSTMKLPVSFSLAQRMDSRGCTAPPEVHSSTKKLGKEHLWQIAAVPKIVGTFLRSTNKTSVRYRVDDTLPSISTMICRRIRLANRQLQRLLLAESRLELTPPVLGAELLSISLAQSAPPHPDWPHLAPRRSVPSTDRRAFPAGGQHVRSSGHRG